MGRLTRTCGSVYRGWTGVPEAGRHHAANAIRHPTAMVEGPGWRRSRSWPDVVSGIPSTGEDVRHRQGSARPLAYGLRSHEASSPSSSNRGVCAAPTRVDGATRGRIDPPWYPKTTHFWGMWYLVAAARVNIATHNEVGGCAPRRDWHAHDVARPSPAQLRHRCGGQSPRGRADLSLARRASGRTGHGDTRWRTSPNTAKLRARGLERSWPRRVAAAGLVRPEAGA